MQNMLTHYKIDIKSKKVHKSLQTNYTKDPNNRSGPNKFLDILNNFIAIFLNFCMCRTLIRVFGGTFSTK